MADLTTEQPLWKKLTSTVGLLVTRDESHVNVQSVEWTYFVAKDPITVAVLVHEQNYSAELLGRCSEFSLTLCSAHQAHLADFCGSFSGRDVLKASSNALAFNEARSLATPWIDGGVMALECSITRRVDLPHYTMVLGEVVDVHGSTDSPPPLVKHDRMFALGPELDRRRVVSAVARTEAGYRVCASSSPTTASDVPYKVAVEADDGTQVASLVVEPNQYGDLDAELRLSPAQRAAARRFVVSRDGNEPGAATTELGQRPRVPPPQHEGRGLTCVSPSVASSTPLAE